MGWGPDWPFALLFPRDDTGLLAPIRIGGRETAAAEEREREEALVEEGEEKELCKSRAKW